MSLNGFNFISYIEIADNVDLKVLTQINGTLLSKKNDKKF